MSESPMRNLFVWMDRVLAQGDGYSLLVGRTRHDTGMRLEDPEEPLLVVEMISIGNSRHVHLWWSMNSPSKRVEWLCRSHCTRGEEGSSPPSRHQFWPL